MCINITPKLHSPPCSKQVSIFELWIFIARMEVELSLQGKHLQVNLAHYPRKILEF